MLYKNNLSLSLPCPVGTKFGAMLDMLTDRCATMCLLVNLALLYPSYTFLFQISMSLDIASHWLHLHRYVTKEPRRTMNCTLRTIYTNNGFSECFASIKCFFWGGFVANFFELYWGSSPRPQPSVYSLLIHQIYLGQCGLQMLGSSQ